MKYLSFTNSSPLMPKREVNGQTPVRLVSFTYKAITEEEEPPKVSKSTNSTTSNTDAPSAVPPSPTPIAPTPRTSRSFIHSVLEEQGGYDATNLSDLYDNLNMVVLKMKSTNCYDTINVEMLPSEVPGGVNISIKARERYWYKLRIGGGVKQFGGSQQVREGEERSDELTTQFMIEAPLAC